MPNISSMFNVNAPYAPGMLFGNQIGKQTAEEVAKKGIFSNLGARFGAGANRN